MSKIEKLAKHLVVLEKSDIDIVDLIILNNTLETLLEQVEDFEFVNGLVEIKLVSYIDNLINELDKVKKGFRIGEKKMTLKEFFDSGVLHKGNLRNKEPYRFEFYRDNKAVGTLTMSEKIKRFSVSEISKVVKFELV